MTVSLPLLPHHCHVKHLKQFQKRLIHSSHKTPSKTEHGARRVQRGADTQTGAQVHALVPGSDPEADPEVPGGEEARVLPLQQIQGGGRSPDCRGLCVHR